MTSKELESIIEETKIAGREVEPRLKKDKNLWSRCEQTDGKADYTEIFSLEIPKRMEGSFRHALTHTGYDPYNVYGHGINLNPCSQDVTLGEELGYGDYVLVCHAEVDNGKLDTLSIHGLDAVWMGETAPIQEYCFASVPKSDEDNFKAIAKALIEQFYADKQYPIVELPDGASKTLTDTEGFEIHFRLPYKTAWGDMKMYDNITTYYGTKTGEVVKMENALAACYEYSHSFMNPEEASEDMKAVLAAIPEKGTLVGTKFTVKQITETPLKGFEK